MCRDLWHMVFCDTIKRYSLPVILPGHVFAYHNSQAWLYTNESHLEISRMKSHSVGCSDWIQLNVASSTGVISRKIPFLVIVWVIPVVRCGWLAYVRASGSHWPEPLLVVKMSWPLVRYSPAPHRIPWIVDPTPSVSRPWSIVTRSPAAVGHVMSCVITAEMTSVKTYAQVRIFSALKVGYIGFNGYSGTAKKINIFHLL